MGDKLIDAANSTIQLLCFICRIDSRHRYIPGRDWLLADDGVKAGHRACRVNQWANERWIVDPGLLDALEALGYATLIAREEKASRAIRIGVDFQAVRNAATQYTAPVNRKWPVFEVFQVISRISLSDMTCMRKGLKVDSGTKFEVVVLLRGCADKWVITIRRHVNWTSCDDQNLPQDIRRATG